MPCDSADGIGSAAPGQVCVLGHLVQAGEDVLEDTGLNDTGKAFAKGAL